LTFIHSTQNHTQQNRPVDPPGGFAVTAQKGEAFLGKGAAACRSAGMARRRRTIPTFAGREVFSRRTRRRKNRLKFFRAFGRELCEAFSTD